jgi:V8-like Glu-specific endopeptidase
MAKGKPTRGRAPKGRSPKGGTGLTDAAIKKGLKTLSQETELPLSPLDHPPRTEAVPQSPMLSFGRMVETNGGSALETVPGFDEFRARNEGLFPVNAPSEIVPAGADDFRLENVIGKKNDLVPVPDTTCLPWRSIAMLSITYQNGGQGVGTAWFLGERALGTAGHNIFHQAYGMATQILVTPAFGSVTPSESYRVVQTFCDDAWLNGNGDAALDYGVILIEDPAIGRRLGWFGFAAYDDKQLDKMLLNVSGYSKERTPRTQYYNGGRLLKVDGQFLRYTFDTEGGMSGAPLFARFDTQRVVVGIHTSGNDTANRARRIDAGLYQVLNRFSTM